MSFSAVLVPSGASVLVANVGSWTFEYAHLVESCQLFCALWSILIAATAPGNTQAGAPPPAPDTAEMPPSNPLLIPPPTCGVIVCDVASPASQSESAAASALLRIHIERVRSGGTCRLDGVRWDVGEIARIGGAVRCIQLDRSALRRRPAADIAPTTVRRVLVLKGQSPPRRCCKDRLKGITSRNNGRAIQGE